MKRNKRKRSLTPLIVVLVVALVIVAGVIAWKQYEYGVSADFYDGLRGRVEESGYVA